MLLSDTELEERLRAGMRALGANTDNGEAGTLARLLVLLDKWNQAFNLTAVREPRDMIGRHVLDSLAVRPYLHGMTILDVGTGAGFPGLVLAVAEPQRQFCLLDSGGKKVRFVRHAAAELGLENVDVVQSRVESYAAPDPYDTVVCRAFSSLGEFVARCATLVARGGRLVAMKGRMPHDELVGVPATWSVTAAERVAVPDVPGDRHIIVLERSD